MTLSPMGVTQTLQIAAIHPEKLFNEYMLWWENIQLARTAGHLVSIVKIILLDLILDGYEIRSIY